MSVTEKADGKGRGALPNHLAESRNNPVLPLIAVAMPGLSVWICASVRASVREVRATGLQVLLDTQIEALNRWVEEKRTDTERPVAVRQQ